MLKPACYLIVFRKITNLVASFLLQCSVWKNQYKLKYVTGPMSALCYRHLYIYIATMHSNSLRSLEYIPRT